MSSVLRITNCRIKPGSTNAALFPSQLSIDPISCAISGTPVSTFAPTEFTIEITNSASVSTTATVTLSTCTSADHLVLVSGDDQAQTLGAALSSPLKVQVVDANGIAACTANLGLTRTLGLETAASQAVPVSIDVFGYANFYPNVGFTPSAWHIILIGVTLPNLAGATNGTRVPFKATPTPVAQSSFSTGTSLSTLSNANAAAAGDFNGDGKLDLVTGDNSTEISIFLGAGDGTFGARNDISLPANSISLWVSVGDFNRDGKLDIVVADMHVANNSTLLVMLGNGDGTFGSPTVLTMPGGATTVEVQVGDFDSDGKLDLVGANLNTNNISVFLGLGDGNFSGIVNYPANSGPSSLAIGDFDKNGTLDIAAANYWAPNVSIYLGVGNGTFAAAVPYGVGGSFPRGIVAGDFDKDGNLDLAVANRGGTTVNILKGVGDGTFNTGAWANLAPAGNPYKVLTADFNADGNLDLIVSNDNTNQVSRFLGNGDGTFSLKSDTAVSAASYGLAVADLNRDQKIDLIVASAVSNICDLLMGN